MTEIFSNYLSLLRRVSPVISQETFQEIIPCIAPEIPSEIFSRIIQKFSPDIPIEHPPEMFSETPPRIIVSVIDKLPVVGYSVNDRVDPVEPELGWY